MLCDETRLDGEWYEELCFAPRTCKANPTAWYRPNNVGGPTAFGAANDAALDEAADAMDSFENRYERSRLYRGDRYFRGDLDDEDMVELLVALADYPVIDDDRRYREEAERQSSAWEDTYESDFEKAVGKVLGGEIEGYPGLNGGSRELFERAAEKFGYGMEEEADGGWWIDKWDARVAEAARLCVANPSWTELARPTSEVTYHAVGDAGGILGSVTLLVSAPTLLDGDAEAIAVPVGAVPDGCPVAEIAKAELGEAFALVHDTKGRVWTRHGVV